MDRGRHRLRRRRTRVVVLVLLGVAGVALATLQIAVERETAGSLEVRNPEGEAGHALVLYHPGLSDLQESLTNAFAQGLVERDWRVTRSTTSAAAPTDMAGFDLLVLGVHTYWWAPDGPTRRYLERAGNLYGLGHPDCAQPGARAARAAAGVDGERGRPRASRWRCSRWPC
jgi:hypothetical protein